MTVPYMNLYLKKLLKQIKFPGLALLSGLLVIAAFPPFEQGYMAWFALLPLIAACLHTNPAGGFWAGFIFGLPLTLYTNLYLSHVLFPYLPTSLAAAAMIGLVVYISLFYGLFGLGAAVAARTGKAWFTALALPSLWLLVEYLRSVSFLAYNVGYLGYTQWGYPLILNITSVYGYWGLPFLIVFFQTLVLLVAMKKLQSAPRFIMSAAFLLLLFIGILLPGFMPGQTSDRHLKVSLIQGNSRPQSIVEGDVADILELYTGLTKNALEENPDIDLVAWPETVARLDFSNSREHSPEIVELGEEYGVSILYGARVKEGDRLYNSVALYRGEKEDIPVYHKHRLVPFVEYFPMEQLLNRILDLDLLLGSYSAGENLTIFRLDDVTLAGAICFESYFGDHTRLFAAEGINHLFIPTNDAWFGESIGLEQHAQAAAIRAAEMGVGVTQVANSGITISFNHRGEELFRSGKNEAAVFTLPLDLNTRDTVYTRYGNYFPVFWALFMAIAWPVAALRRAT